MTDKQINTCEFFNICEAACGGTLEDTEMCHCYELYKQLKRKELECEIWENQVLTIDDEAVTVEITQQQFKEYNQLKQKEREGKL